MMTRRRLGVIGGLGPASTAVFYDHLTRRYYDSSRGAYPSLLIDSLAIDDAIESTFVTGRGSPREGDRVDALLSESFDLLLSAGVAAIALACNTAHFWAEPIASRLGVTFLSMPRATLEAAAARGLRRGLVLGSAGTNAFRIYQRHATASGVELVYPDAAAQEVLSQCIMRLVREPLHAEIRAAIDGVVAAHADAVEFVILGCTDLAALQTDRIQGLPTFDSLLVLADACVAFLLEGPSAAPLAPYSARP